MKFIKLKLLEWLVPILFLSLIVCGIIYFLKPIREQKQKQALLHIQQYKDYCVEATRVEENFCSKDCKLPFLWGLGRSTLLPTILFTQIEEEFCPMDWYSKCKVALKIESKLCRKYMDACMDRGNDPDKCLFIPSDD